MDKKTLTEQEIRSQFIRKSIVAAGWTDQMIREEHHYTDGRMHITGQKAVRGKSKYVDYLLVYNNVRLAVVEAKDNKHSLGAGMQQGLVYAADLEVPFVYSSNGDGFLEHDKLGTSATVETELALEAFPSPEELWSRYRNHKALTADQEKIITADYFWERGGKEPRYYQEIAINRTMQAIANGQDRILLVMATGTGKTFTVSQIIWRLRKARPGIRILFLADRNILVDQAMTNDFKQFGDVMTKIRRRQIDKSFELYLALYQGVSGSEEWQDVYKQFSADFFDLVIVDECHRGSAAEDSAWREVLEYFKSAVQIGLTATPKETEYVSNIDYFGDPVYVYSLKQGIEDGFLAPYKVIRINVDKDVDGWMPFPGQTDKYGNVIEDREYGLTDWDRSVVLEQRNQLVAKRTADFMALTDPYGKGIVFCVDIAHAERMRQFLVNALGPEAAANHRYVMRITGDSQDGKLELDNFITPEEKFPVIATTSKLLTTGVDVQTCKLIVLDTVINSMTEFKQIIGRGTRLRPDLDKTHFTIIDFRNATRLFFDPKFDGIPEHIYEPGPEEPPLPPADVEPVEGGDDDEDDQGQGRPKYFVDDVPVAIIAERVQYYDAQGRLVTKSFTEFSRENVLKEYRTLDEFLDTWETADRKKEILVELIRRGVLLEELAEQVGRDYDPFDLVCHVAYDRPPLTRRERVLKVQKQDVFSNYGETARQVLAALLERYADDGIDFIEEAADSKTMSKTLELDPLRQYGTPMEIVRAFGGRRAYSKALSQIGLALYQVQQ